VGIPALEKISPIYIKTNFIHSRNILHWLWWYFVRKFPCSGFYTWLIFRMFHLRFSAMSCVNCLWLYPQPFHAHRRVKIRHEVSSYILT